ncbi:hypothetical protein ACFE04_012464 [Oxalis oulophora]
MNLSSLSLTLTTNNKILIFKPSINPLQFNHKRRRLKLYNHKVSIFNSIEQLILAPAAALGLFTGAAAILFSKVNPIPNSHIGDWVLFTSPTPFNRFVILRCPSISVQDDVNDRFVKEDRHFVKVNSGRVCVNQSSDDFALGEEEGRLEYQRVCVCTDDGGVLSLDWPANLNLKEEYGLDSTVLLVPGTADGSMDKDVRLFVCEALGRGLFPIVMNPRGCAGSPLTTARLFTAADSDDISTAIQFINKARPWTTLMAVGWGYGANMLTKYLAEVGERTPLMAATCIDNPFDLEEATRSSPHHIALDKKLSGGLISILESNKELFKGREKGFDVERAILAKSVRDFEQAISMVSYGFDAIEDFYSKCSTRNLVGNVKIPVLFIQNNDGTSPLFSVPRSLIAQNPYTSLLLCSCLPSDLIKSGKSVAPWCQHLIIEWLTAVELGLLKGRHPLLEDVDVNINPLNGFALSEGMDEKNNKLLDLKLSNGSNNYTINPLNEVLADNNTVKGIHLRKSEESVRKLDVEVQGSQGVDNVVLQHTDTELVKEDEDVAVDTENGEVLQTAQVVMNMLDVTIPGTLSEEEKKKVLISVAQGETLMKALEMAVPEDVRAKLTTSVTGILNAQRTNLKFGKLMGIDKIPDKQTEPKIESQEKVIGQSNNGNIPEQQTEPKIESQEKVRGQSNNENLCEDPNSSDQIRKVDNLADGSDNVSSGTDSPPSEPHLSEISNTVQARSSQHDDSDSLKKVTNESGNNQENDEMFKEKNVKDSDFVEKGTDTSSKPDSMPRAEKPGSPGEVEERKAYQDGGPTQLETKEENNTPNNDGKLQDSSNDQNNTGVAEQATSSTGSSAESHSMESDDNDNQKRENENPQPLVDQNKSVAPGPPNSPPTFNVSQALDALTGMDDSTQVAVNSVFGVIENMISQLEESENGENKVEDKHEVTESTDVKINTVSHKQSIDDGMLEESSVIKDLTLQSETGSKTEWLDQGHGQNPISYEENGTDDNQLGGNRKKKNRLHGDELLADYSNKPRRVNKFPLYVVANSYRELMHSDHFRRYLSSKIPSTELLDQDSTAALLLDYFPEEGQWKLLEQSDDIEDLSDDVTNPNGFGKDVGSHSPARGNEIDDFIEPSYVVLDSENDQEPVRDNEGSNLNESAKNNEDRKKELTHFAKLVIFDCLRIEVDRKLNASEKRKIESDLSKDIEQVANAVSLAVRCHEEQHSCPEKIISLNGGKIIRAISSAIQRTSYLRKVLPVGVVVGSCLAALRKYFDVSTVHDNKQREGKTFDEVKKSRDNSNNHDMPNPEKTSELHKNEELKRNSLNGSLTREVDDINFFKKDTAMVGALTAALGASALYVQHQILHLSDSLTNTYLNSWSMYKGAQNVQDQIESSSKPFMEKDHKEPERNHNSIVTNLAEKAMSVAGPVVPTKEDGGVDQERLVAMLADLGQRGGALKLVAKIALLWGGLRGATSLTNKLISFLHISERPLPQRILAFSGMVLVLWSPIVVPLLPALMQGWTTNNPAKFSELVCIIGLYTAILILVTLWGKRIRGYENPLKQYGLDLAPPSKVQSFFQGLIGGVSLVLFIQSVNALLGCASVSWFTSHPLPVFDAMAWLKVCGTILVLFGQGIITSTAVAVVEELLFLAWLPREITADFGYHQGIIISGLAFALFQRSPWAIPGLWLLSLALAGIRERNQGNLLIPVGVQAGIMATSFALQKGGFVTYNPNYATWVAGNYPWQPFSGAVGFGCSLLLAIILYPRKPRLRSNKRTRN